MWPLRMISIAVNSCKPPDDEVIIRLVGCCQSDGWVQQLKTYFPALMCANWVKCKTYRTAPWNEGSDGQKTNWECEREKQTRWFLVWSELQSVFGAYIACQEASADFLPVRVEDAAVFVQVTFPLCGHKAQSINNIKHRSISTIVNKHLSRWIMN